MNNKILLGLLILLVCLPMTSTDIFVPMLPQMVLDLHSNNHDVSYVLSVYMMGFAVSMLTTGYFSDIYGRRKVLICTISLYIVSCVLIAMSHNLLVVIVLRFFQGLGGGSGTVVGRLIVKDVFKSDKQLSIMSSLSSGMAIAPAIAPQIGAFIGNHWGWHGCFIATFLIGAIILYALVFFLQETNSYIINRTHTSQKLENHLMKLPTSFLRVFFNKQFLGYTLLISFSFSAYFVFIGLSSFLFQNIFNYSSTQYSYIILLVTTGYLIGTSLTKTLNKKKYSIEQIIVIGTIICMVSSFSLLFTFILQSSWLIIFSMMWMRLGIGLIMPSSQVGAMKCTNHSAGWNMGCLFFVEFIISAIMIALGSYIDSFHIGYGLIASILLSMIFVFTGYRLIKN